MIIGIHDSALLALRSKDCTRVPDKIGMLIKWINVFGVITGIHDEVYFSGTNEVGDSWAISVLDGENGEIIIDMDETYVEVING